MAKIKVGTRVAYSRAFLRSCGMFAGREPFARGVVTEIETLSPGCDIARIKWDDGEDYRVNVKNLWPEARLHLEPV